MNSPDEPTDSANSLNTANSADLDWQAWLYVAGELAEADRAAFEARLLTDCAACEAVARAVELLDLMAAATPAIVRATAISAQGPLLSQPGAADFAPEVVPVGAVSQGNRWSQRVSWMALGAAACLAVMLAGRTWQLERAWQPGESPDVAMGDNSEESAALDDDARTLAVVWTDLWNMDDALAAADSDDDALDRADSVLVGAVDGERDSAPPDWLLAAVTSPTEGAEPTKGSEGFEGIGQEGARGTPASAPQPN
ncbi:MAG TPA: hypothetical protein VGJ26_10100 [Pirellulales bacterium]